MIAAAQRRTQRGGAVSTLISLVFLVILCAALYFARHPIMRFTAETWVVDQPAAHADALVVLSGDNFYADRATHAAKLYRQGAAPIVVASGKRLRPNAGEAELVEHDLVERGVPKDKILQLPQDADSTLEESLAVRKLAEDRGWKSLILVTSNYHTRRALYIFQHRLPPTISVTVASAPDGDFDPEHWWEKRISAKRFFHEFVGMVDSAWELRGSRPASTPSS
jgi:uncharacterized SAM-binding protein YcdF (DUF218 family)